MSKIYPVTDRVIIIPDPIDQEKKHGLLVPDDSKEKPNYATVYSVGPNCKQTKEGDRVIYPHKYGTNLKFEGQDMIIMKESDLWGIISQYDDLRTLNELNWEEISRKYLEWQNKVHKGEIQWLKENYIVPTLIRK